MTPARDDGDDLGAVRLAVVRVFAVLMLASLVACGGPVGPASDVPEGSVAPLVERAERMRERGALDGAVESYREALDRTPWNDRIKSALAATLAERSDKKRDRGDYPGAVEDLEQARALEPEDVTLKRNLAVVLAEQAARAQTPAEARALRARATELDPTVTREGQVVDSTLERKLDLAFELIERDQLDAASTQLGVIHVQYPDDVRVSRLLVQTLVRRGAQLSDLGNHLRAGEVLDSAVEVYAAAPDCQAPEWASCPVEDVRTAHYNRVVAYLNAYQPEQAERALEAAASQGLDFPRLAGELERQREFK